MTRFAFLDAPTPIAFAHRGGAGGGIENSLAAFQHAVKLGYRYLETDVHATRDGVLIAFHDRTLDRVTDRTGAVAELSFSEVCRARIAGREPIPTLEDLLEELPTARFNIDVKVAAAIEPLARVLRRMDAHARVCVGAFSDRRLAAARRALGPRVATSLGPHQVARLRALAGTGTLATRLSAAGTRGLQRYACVQVPPAVRGVPILTPGFLTLAHRIGLQVHVWTIDDPATMHQLLDLGVDGIMTDEIGTLRDVLSSRGAWPRSGQK
ncbi:MAG: glycerophosphodiester phosphodiesterase [Mycobacteriales bacterium]